MISKHWCGGSSLNWWAAEEHLNPQDASLPMQALIIFNHFVWNVFTLWIPTQAWEFGLLFTKSPFHSTAGNVPVFSFPLIRRFFKDLAYLYHSLHKTTVSTLSLSLPLFMGKLFLLNNDCGRSLPTVIEDGISDSYYLSSELCVLHSDSSIDFIQNKVGHKDWDTALFPKVVSTFYSRVLQTLAVGLPFPSPAWAEPCVLLGKVWKTPYYSSQGSLWPAPSRVCYPVKANTKPSVLCMCSWLWWPLGAVVGFSHLPRWHAKHC